MPKLRKPRVNAYQEELLGGQIREAIINRLATLGLRNKDLAQQLGVSEGRVSQILSGPEHLTVGSLVGVATALGGRWDVFFWPEDSLDPRLARSGEEGPTVPVTSEHVPLPPPVTRDDLPFGAPAPLVDSLPPTPGRVVARQRTTSSR